MKNRRVFLWGLSLLPLLLCFESSAYAQNPPKIRPYTTPTCNVDIHITDNKEEYSTTILLYREDGSYVLKAPRFINTTHYQLRLVDVGNYFVKLRGKHPATPPGRRLFCREGQTLNLLFKIRT